MHTPLYKKIKKNGTTLYVFPGVTEDTNYETQNENYNMYLSHFALVKFPKLDESIFKNTFVTTGSPTSPYSDALIESLRNYVANQEVVIRNTKTNSTDYYYDVFENYTVTEKVFWKWAKKIGAIDFDLATNAEYPMSSPEFDANSSNSIHHQREYLWTERKNTIYNPTYISPANDEIRFATPTNFKPGDKILINEGGLDGNTGLDYSILTVYTVSDEADTNGDGTVDDTSLYNNKITLDPPMASTPSTSKTELEISLVYDQFIQFMSEITGVNNVQLPNRAYTEAYAYISNQQGKTPYILWRTLTDKNYKPNSTFPIISSQLQGEIQGGENANNPILTNPSQYPGSIWAQFDTTNHYETSNGDSARRDGDYFGNNNTVNETSPTSFSFTNFDSSELDGLTIDFDINHYSKATSYTFPVDTFKEFSATNFDEVAPKDFEFNCILWFYTIEDVSGDNVEYATNLYGIEFLDSPEGEDTSIPLNTKLVTNGEQDGNSYTFSLDTNVEIESYTDTFEFDPNKVYSLFGMELYYEALTRMTYMNDQLSDIIAANASMRNKINNLQGLIYTQESVDSIKQQIITIKDLLNVYSTLQIGESDTIIPSLDTSVSPALIRLKSIDKKYGTINHIYTKDLFTQFVNNSNKTEISSISTTPININSGKDFMIVVNNNDNLDPSPEYDTSIIQDNLYITIDNDLQFKQTLDILIKPTLSEVKINNNEYPINDKKLEIFINYNNGTTVNTTSLGKFALPVLKYETGPNTNIYEDEVSTIFDKTPSFKIYNALYSISSVAANLRTISFIVEEDFVKTPKFKQNMRIFLQNFKLQQDPTVLNSPYINMSDQYAISTNPTYMGCVINAINVVDGGTGYTTGFADIELDIEDETGTSTTKVLGGAVDITAPGGTITEALFNLPTNFHGIITDIRINQSSNISAEVEYSYTVLSKINIDINSAVNNQDIINMLAKYDTILSSSNNINITKYLEELPTLMLLKETLISITRISDDENVPLTQIDKRYNIKISHI